MENSRVLLINSIIKKQDIMRKHNEMLNLLETLDLFPSEVVSQELDCPYFSTYLGRGKVLEIKDLIDDENIEIVVCNFDLTPVQYVNLKNIWNVDIFDRTGVILKIFSLHAKSKEAQLQVQIANLMYLKNRLINPDANYEQVTSGGLKNKGSGEKQINLDRQKFKLLLKRKQNELAKLVVQRKNNRKNRFKLPVVAIVGYTNAGKSTLMNVFLKKSHAKESKKVVEENRLFATLETSTRLIDIFEYPNFLLTDTVGFIDDLPTILVESFKSTLEEIKEADVLIEVVDVSTNYIHDMEVTNEILKEIGVSNIPKIILYNKFDLCGNVPFIPKQNEMFVSLNYDDDFKDILNLVFNVLKRQWAYYELEVPFYKNINLIKKYGFVQKIHTLETNYLIIIYVPKQNISSLFAFLND